MLNWGWKQLYIHLSCKKLRICRIWEEVIDKSSPYHQEHFVRVKVSFSKYDLRLMKTTKTSV